MEDDWGSPSNTARLLWAASSLRRDPDVVRELIAGGADLNLAAEVALARRVAPFLAAALDEVGPVDVDPAVHDALHREARLRRFQETMLLPAAVALAVEPLAAKGFEPVIFKGPAVAGRYPAPGLRAMDDIDVILPTSQHDAGIAALRDAGWVVVDRGEGHYDTVLRHRDVPHLMLELHRSLGGWREWSSRMTSKELWRRRVPLTCYGTTAFGLQPEDELVALSAHAGKRFHLFARMIWSVDLAVVVQAAGPALDWDRVARVARRAGCTTVVAVGLRHARRLGADVPDELLLLPASRLRRAALAPLLSEEWPLLDPVAGGHHRLVYALWDSWARRMLAGLREVSVEGFSQAPRHAKEEVGLAVRRVRAWRGVEVPDRAPVPSVSSSRGDQAP